MSIKTRLSDLLGIQYPIIQGGMAWVATAELAAAVSEAGGLGLIGAGSAPPEVVRDEIRKIRDLTRRPFGVNVYFLSPFAQDVMELLMEERVPVVTTGAGNPGKYVAGLHERGIKVLALVASVNLARRLERAGVDGVIAEGRECGGHVGDIHTMPLVPQIASAVKIPVVAAGGIFDGRGLLAALALGAEGVQLGTRFVCAAECTVHPNYKQAIIAAKDRDTVVTGQSTGHPARIIENAFSRAYAEAEARGATPQELDALGAGRLRMAAVAGDLEGGSLMAGQIASMVTKIEPARDIITDIVRTAESALERVTGAFGPR